MTYSLQDRMEISVFINDNEYHLDTINLLNYLHIGTSVRGSLPTLTMAITDVRHELDLIGLQDGIPIRIVIRPNGKQTRTYNFRKFNHTRELVGGAYVWTIHGYWNAPLYWNTTTSVGISGTSDDALQNIAKVCDLKYDGTHTNDSQLWLPKNKSYRTFAKDISDSGYITDTSCMVLGVDLDATLRYKNVNDLPAAKKKVVAYTNVENAYTAVDVTISANSGFNNAITGYQNMRYAQSTTSDLQKQIQDLSFTADSKAPLYNTTLKSKLGRGPVRFGPIDVGNVHDNYERADYQNARYRNMFSMGLELLFIDITDFKLLEQINFSVQREDASQDVGNSGDYTITGHSLYVQGAKYFEKIGVVRHGTNEKPVNG